MKTGNLPFREPTRLAATLLVMVAYQCWNVSFLSAEPAPYQPPPLPSSGVLDLNPGHRNIEKDVRLLREGADKEKLEVLEAWLGMHMRGTRQTWPGAVPAIESLLASPNPEVAAAAWKMVIPWKLEHRYQELAEGLEKDFPGPMRMHHGPLKVWTDEDFADGDTNLGWHYGEIVDAFHSLGSAGSPVLARIAKGNPAAGGNLRRLMALEILRRIGDQSALDAFSSASTDRNENVAYAGIRNLRDLGSKEACDVLFELTKLEETKGPRQKDNLFSALADSGDERAREWMIEQVKNASHLSMYSLQRWVAKSQLGTSVPVLLSGLGHTDEKRRQWCLVELLKISGESHGTDATVWNDWWRRARNQTELERLLHNLNHTPTPNTDKILTKLTLLADPAAIPGLLEFLENCEDKQRINRVNWTLASLVGSRPFGGPRALKPDEFPPETMSLKADDWRRWLNFLAERKSPPRPLGLDYRPLKQLGKIRCDVGDLAISGDRLLVGGSAALSILDISDPARPHILSRYPVARQGVGALAFKGDRFYLAAYQGGLSCYTLGTNGEVTHLHTMPETDFYQAFSWQENRLLVVEKDTATLWDASDPRLPKSLQAVPIRYPENRIARVGRKVLTTAPWSGNRIELESGLPVRPWFDTSSNDAVGALLDPKGGLAVRTKFWELEVFGINPDRLLGVSVIAPRESRQMAIHGKRLHTIGLAWGLTVQQIDSEGFPWLVSRTPVENLESSSRDHAGRIAVSEKVVAVHNGHFLFLYAPPE